MSDRKPFTLSARVRSFVCAWRGLRIVLATQHNAWIHALATTAVLLAGLTIGLSKPDWCAVAVAVTIVWTAEGLNTAFEFLTDVASPEFHPLAEKAKDVAAGAVLFAVAGAVVVGLLVFVPHLISLWGGGR